MNNDTSFDIIQESNPVQTVAPTNKEDIPVDALLKKAEQA